MEEFLALGARLRRLSDQLMADGTKIYRRVGADFEPRWLPVFHRLHAHGPSCITDIARFEGVSHATVNKMATELIAAGWVAPYRDSRDRRRRLLALTAQGKQLARRLVPVWAKMADAVRSASGDGLPAQVAAFEAALAARGLLQRFADDSGIEVVPFDARYRRDFCRLNEAWITSLFEMEEADLKVLRDPEGSIVAKGGDILFAIDRGNGAVVGTCALIAGDDGVCELAKMAVTPTTQNRGIGRRLGEAFIERARDLGFATAFLETNRRLAPALALYRRLGFVEKPFPYQSDYSRADVYMEITL